MTLPTILTVLLMIAVVMAWARLLLRQFRASTSQRSRAWRLVALLAAQPVCGILLYFTLLPPTLATRSGALIIATRHATAGSTNGVGNHLIALPEAPALSGAERAPDLATALRRYAGTTRLTVVGDGLEERDRDTGQGLKVNFEPAPAPRGLARINSPRTVASGATFHIGGQVNEAAGGTVELLDPGDHRVDVVTPTKFGDFVLTGTTRIAGPAMFKLRVRDSQNKLVEEAAVPIWTVAEPPERIFLLAGAPDPELKYIRRWATDAGFALHTQLAIGGGVQLGDAPLPLNAVTLREFDLLVLDERNWLNLGSSEREAIVTAVRNGLGLLIRVTGPTPDLVRRQWQTIGFAVSGGMTTVTLRLKPQASDDDMRQARAGPGTHDVSATVNRTGAEPELTRRDLKIVTSDAVPLLRDASDHDAAVWRTEGQGRIALWTVTDSFRLVLAGRGDRFENLWSASFATLSRGRRGSVPLIDSLARVHQRLTISGLGARPVIVDPSGRVTRLLPDAASWSRDSAAYWPSSPGWHRLQQRGERNNSETWPFFVIAQDALPGVRATTTREQTLRLVGTAAALVGQPAAVKGGRSQSWPWFIAWLTVSAGLWWLERTRFGRV